jgi:hypothetical protein
MKRINVNANVIKWTKQLPYQYSNSDTKYSWALMDGEYYFYKSVKDDEINRQLICEKILETIELDTIKSIVIDLYSDFTDYSEIGLFSKCFAQKGYNYKYLSDLGIKSANEYPYNTFEPLKGLLNLALKKERFIENAIKYMTMCFYTGQWDIHKYNLIFKEKGNFIEFNPIFDMGRCLNYDFTERRIWGHNRLLSSIGECYVPSDEYKDLISFSNNGYRILETFITLNMKNIIEEVEDNEQKIITDKEIIISYTDDKRNKIEKSLKKK